MSQPANNELRKKADAAFEKLQHSVADMTAKLKKDLGLGA